MKRFRKLISVLVVLVMALTAVCCAGGETATDLEKQILGTWDLTDIRGTGLGDDTIGTVMEMAKLMGGSILFTFRSGGVYSMEFSILGQNDSVDGTYTVSDGTISLDGAEMSCVVDGNEMYLGSGEGGAIVLTRLGGGETAGTETAGGTAEEAAELIGDWKVISVYVEEGSEGTLASRIEPYVNEGNVFGLTFTADQISIGIMDTEDANADTAPYTVSGDKLSIAGVIEMTWQIYEGRLILSQGSDVIGLEKLKTEAEPAAEKETVPELIGKWDVLSVYVEEGSDTTLASRMQAYVDAGNAFALTFTADDVSISLDGETAETVPYTVSGEDLVIGGTIQMTWMLYEGRLILTEGSDIIGLGRGDEGAAAGSASVEGTWKVTDITGIEEYSTILKLGGTITMTFGDGKVSMDAELMGMTSSQEGTYTDSAVTFGDAETGYEIDGDTLMISDGETTMLLTRE